MVRSVDGMRCQRCNRPLKHPGVFGPVCRKREAPAPAIERDLFGYDIDRAVQAARVSLALFIAWSVLDARIALRGEFEAARRRLGVAA